jgi:multiple sugar transport system permease protein
LVPTALSTLGWWWMFNSLYSVVNWTGIALGLMDPPGPNWLGEKYYGMAAMTARPALLRHHHPGRARRHPAGVLRGGRGRRRRGQCPLLAHHPPLLKPVLAVVVLFSTIFTFSDFNIIYILTNGGPINSTRLFATLSRVVGIDTGRIAEGAAILLYLFSLLAFVVWAQLRFGRKQAY